MGNKCREELLRFIAAVIGSGLCILLDNADVFRGVLQYGMAVDVQYFWMNSIIYGGIFGGYFISVLAVLPRGNSFCREYQEGVWRYRIARAGTGRYVIEKAGKTFLAGGLSACCGGLLLVSGLSCILPLFDKGRAAETGFLPFSNLLAKTPILYFGVMLYLLFLSAGLWATVSLCFSGFAPVPYLVYLFPFVVSFLLTRINTMLHIPDVWRLDFMLQGRRGPETLAGYLTIVTLMAAVLCCLCGYLFYRMLKWRIANE